MAEYTESDVLRILEEIRQEYKEAVRRGLEESEDYKESEELDEFEFEEYEDDDDAVLVDVEEQTARSAAVSGTLDELIAWVRRMGDR